MPPHSHALGRNVNSQEGSIKIRAITIILATPLLLAGFAAAAVPAGASSTTVCQQLVPSAYGPTVWSASESSTPVPADIIANWGQGYDGAGGGPGLSRNSANLATVHQAQAHGMQELGYVWTDYANNAAGNPVQPWMTPAPLSAVENEALEWYTWYGVNHFFFDGATTGTTNGQLGYYQRLYSFIHAHIPGSQVWINPGWYPSSAAYMSAADVIMDFEGSYSTLTANPPPSWVHSYPASRFANVLQLPDSQSSSLGAALSLTRADNAGHVYIADQSNYSALPAYWRAEDADVTAECGA
jgi:hypothetical protein